MMLPTISDTAINALGEAAAKIQAELFDRTGEQFDLTDLNEVLAKWLELSIEELCEEAAFHCVTGDRLHAFNRAAFELFLKKVPSAVASGAEAAQEAKDQAAIALDRAA
jgi:hypothetical protein